MKRADQVLVDFGLARSRSHAAELIKNGYVEYMTASDWQKAKKPSQPFEGLSKEQIRVREGLLNQFVSRGGVKLQGALQHLGLDVTGFAVLDVGQSTGGFTDCLLQNGARHVYGIDVGRDQISAALLKEKTALTVVEGTHIENLDVQAMENSLGGAPDLVVADVSFISMTKVLPILIEKLGREPIYLLLVKPQFEVGSSGLGKGGRVKDPELYGGVREEMVQLIKQLGLECSHYFESSIEGGDGNKEFFLHATKAH